MIGHADGDPEYEAGQDVGYQRTKWKRESIEHGDPSTYSVSGHTTQSTTQEDQRNVFHECDLIRSSITLKVCCLSAAAFPLKLRTAIGAPATTLI